MNKALVFSLLCGALVAGCKSDKGGTEDKTTTSTTPMAHETAVLIPLNGTVESINHTTREVTLLGAGGNTVSFVASPDVKRFNEISVGDKVHAEYYTSVAAEVRKPTAEEEKHPLTVTEAGGTTSQGLPPAVAGGRQYKAVTTIEKIDKAKQDITIKGPMGNERVIHVSEPSRLKELHVGQNIVVTYTEAMAVALEKVK